MLAVLEVRVVAQVVLALEAVAVAVVQKLMEVMLVQGVAELDF